MIWLIAWVPFFEKSRFLSKKTRFLSIPRGFCQKGNPDGSDICLWREKSLVITRPEMTGFSFSRHLTGIFQVQSRWGKIVIIACFPGVTRPLLPSRIMPCSCFVPLANESMYMAGKYYQMWEQTLAVWNSMIRLSILPWFARIVPSLPRGIGPEFYPSNDGKNPSFAVKWYSSVVVRLTFWMVRCGQCFGVRQCSVYLSCAFLHFEYLRISYWLFVPGDLKDIEEMSQFFALPISFLLFPLCLFSGHFVTHT